MKKPLQTTLITGAGLLAVSIVALAVVPLFFEDRIVELLRTELNERLDATVTFDDVDLSLLSTFPAFTVEVTDLGVAGKDEFEGIELLRAASVAAGIDLVALIFDDQIEIESIVVDEPKVYVLVNEEGEANYDILGELGEPSDDDAGTGDEVAFDIERYEVHEGTLRYEGPGIEIVADGLSHEGRLRVTGSDQELESQTQVDALSVRLGGIRYLSKARARVDLDAELQSEQGILTIESVRVALNQLAIDGSGSIAWAGEGIDLHVALASREGLSIKALISAVPNAYAADFQGLEASGAFSLRAKVEGQLGPEDGDIPSFEVTARVREGKLKYPDLPLGITELELDATIDHPGGHLDKLTVSIPKYRLAAGQSRVAGSLRITRPLSKPNLDLVLDGRFDLAEIAKAYPVPDSEGLAGLIEAKVDLSAKGQQISKLTGAISAREVTYRSAGGPHIEIAEAAVELSPTSTTVQRLRAKVGTSDINVRGLASPLTTFLMDDQTITASLWLTSNQLRVEDFLGEGTEAKDEQGKPSSPLVLPDDLDARLDLDVKTLTYGDLVLKDFKGSGRIKNRKLILNGVRANALGGSMKLDGTLTTHPRRPAAFDMTYVVDKVSFADAFEALPSVRAYAPIARFLDGRFSTDLRASGTLGDDLSPRLDSVDANGLVAALQSKLSSDFKPLQELSNALPAVPKPLNIESFRTRFAIDDGAVEVKPFTAKARGLTMTVSGRHGLDQEMKYRVATEVPIDSLSSKLASEVGRLGVDLTKVETVGVQANLTGSIKSPRVVVDVDTKALRGTVADALSAELAEQQARAMKEVEGQADHLISEAEKQADRIRSEAKRAAEKARKEGYARADQLEREAVGNPLKEIAAREGAKRIRSETDKRVDQAVNEANRRADQVMNEAQKRAADLLREAAARSKQGTEGVEKQTSDKIR